MSAERLTLDTNVLVYSVDARAGVRQQVARDIIERAVHLDCWLTLQAVSEFYAAATRKGMMPLADAAAQAADWLDLFPTIPASVDAVRAALGTACVGRASYWDAMLLASAAGAGCTVVLSEDMADGSVVQGVRVLNPFGPAGLSPGAARLLTPA